MPRTHLHTNHRHDNRNTPTSRRALTAALTLLWAAAAVLTAVSCARMGHPDGGWYDETPPMVIGTSPADGATQVKARKVSILFDEFVKIENATEKVVVSPPQTEMPEIKSGGKKIEVELKDSLRANTTYTIDFSDAITDNNEGNPLGNYTYTFSTGDNIDTLQIAGNVLTAENLEPVKGMLVGLYDELNDTAFTTMPMLRIARTDSRGRFVIKGVAPGKYRIRALNDVDADYRFSQKSEMIAFNTDTIAPSTTDAVRQDTTWLDSLRIKTIAQVGYTRFVPDDIVLRAFTEPLTDRYLIKSERQMPERLTFYFSSGDNSLPHIEGIDFDATDAFITESSAKRDTVSYWLKDTTLVNRDTLSLRLTYMATDTLGVLRQQTDTLQMLAKQTYERRMKDLQREHEDWQRKQERKKKRGEPYDSIMPPPELKYELSTPRRMAPDQNLVFEFKTPISDIDLEKIHLYSRHDSLWYNAPFELVATGDTIATHHAESADSLAIDSLDAPTAEPYVLPMHRRRYTFRAEWRPDTEYSLELDSGAFTDIYGKSTTKYKQGLKVNSLNDFGTLLLTINGMQGRPLVVQLLNTSDAPVKEVRTKSSTAEFFYITPGRYYVRLIVDDNDNGRWDTGDYASGTQPEEVYYYHEAIECREKWDISKQWSPRARQLTQQKPSQITKQKAEQTAKIKQRNVARAADMGINYTPDMQQQMKKRMKRQQKD